jgi:hypothetical protein
LSAYFTVLHHIKGISYFGNQKASFLMLNNPLFEAVPIRIPLSPPKLRNLSVAEFFIQYESGALPA